MKFVYFASPMCSWCWGFSPVMQRLKASFPANNIRLVLTPFRIDTMQPMDDALRNYVLGQWHNVHKATGQPFDFSFAMPIDFIYNTRLVCLSIKAFSKQLPEQELDFLHTLQHAFYTENKDLANEEILIELTSNYAIDQTLFADDINNNEIADELESDFKLCQQLAIQSYPTLMAENDSSYAMLASGYTPYEELVVRIEASVTS
ncbi:MAG: DsbA family protein [Gammaproteobacteria bacterium]|nr:DsbA family protein [Gammaproteobacteria bacterium]